MTWPNEGQESFFLDWQCFLTLTFLTAFEEVTLNSFRNQLREKNPQTLLVTERVKDIFGWHPTLVWGLSNSKLPSQVDSYPFPS